VTARAVSTFAPIGPFLEREKSQLALVCNDFLAAFQAYDEGSIPFTRSNLFKHLRHGHVAILTKVLPLILTKPERLFSPRAASWPRPRPASWCA
jgi:hypothetical protein